MYVEVANITVLTLHSEGDSDAWYQCSFDHVISRQRSPVIVHSENSHDRSDYVMNSFAQGSAFGCPTCVTEFRQRRSAACSFDAYIYCAGDQIFLPEDRRNRGEGACRAYILIKAVLPEHERHAYILAHNLNSLGFDQSSLALLFTPRPHIVDSQASSRPSVSAESMSFCGILRADLPN